MIVTYPSPSCLYELQRFETIKIEFFWNVALITWKGTNILNELTSYIIWVEERLGMQEEMEQNQEDENEPRSGAIKQFVALVRAV